MRILEEVMRDERGYEIKWFAYTTAVAISGIILKNTVYPVVGVTLVWWAGFVLTVVGLAGNPFGMGVAILRYRLYQIDLIINRTLVYGSLSGKGNDAAHPRLVVAPFNR